MSQSLRTEEGFEFEKILCNYSGQVQQVKFEAKQAAKEKRQLEASVADLTRRNQFLEKELGIVKKQTQIFFRPLHNEVASLKQEFKLLSKFEMPYITNVNALQIYNNDGFNGRIVKFIRETLVYGFERW